MGIIREAWPPARSFENNDKVHGAWSAVDRALERFGQRVTDHLSPSTVKRLVAGNGKAEKEDVADAVRKLLGLSPDYVFASDDESDACAVVLAWLIQNGVIDT
jgi:crossover junction endodeoxyribonuclease RuvC